MPAAPHQNSHPSADTSPWTLAYEMYCKEEDQSGLSSSSAEQEEQQPTHDALVNVYNRDYPMVSDERVSF